MKTELVTGEMPLLGPGANVLENLMQYPIPILRQAAEKRGLQVRAKASRAELANRLLRETVRRQQSRRRQGRSCGRSGRGGGALGTGKSPSVRIDWSVLSLKSHVDLSNVGRGVP